MLAKIDQAIYGYLNLYGIIGFDDFIFEIMDEFYESTRADYPNFKVYLNKLFESEALQACHYTSKDDMQYLCAPSMIEPEKILEMRKNIRQPRNYKKFTVKAALAAGEEGPDSIYGLDNKYGKAVKNMLEKFGYSGEELSMELYRIWQNSQQVTDENVMEDLFYSVTSRMSDIDSYEEFKNYIKVIADYANNAPKWALKGYSAVKRKTLLINLVDDIDEEGEESFIDIDKDMMVQYDLVDRMLVPKVDLDDPCPCGSGLKYRSCHGKYLN